MRKILAASAVALLAFAGQAAAAEGMGNFNFPFCGANGNSAAGAAESGFLGACTTSSLIALSGLIAIAALVVDNNDHGKSA